MEAILKELEKRWPSKKVLRAELEKIQKQLEHGQSKDPLAEYDLDVTYQMKVKSVTTPNSWEEEISNPHRYTEEEAVKVAKEIIQNWNKTLREGDVERELLGVYKITKLTDKKKIG